MNKTSSYTIILFLALTYKEACSFLHSSKVFTPKVATDTDKLIRNTLSLSQDIEQETKTTTIRFHGIQKISTEPIKLPNNDKCIIEFFKQHRNLLLSSIDNVEVVSSPSQMDIDKWNMNNVAKDSNKDEIVQVQTMMQFPGLRATASSVLGTRLISIQDTFPEYQFTLLNSYNKAEGLPPAVWMYNLLTGNNTKKKKDNLTSSYSTVSIQRRGNEYVFTTNAELQVNIKFPSKLLKIIPLSKDTLEERGSLAIQKELEKQVGPNLERFRSAYIHWLKS